MRRSTRPGYTLLQLLVLLAVLLLFLGLFFPAIAGVRVTSARMQSMNNLKQLGLGLHAYHDALGKLPPGVNDDHFSGLSRILPYIEQDNVYKNIDFTRKSDDPANDAMRNVRIKLFLSPIDPLQLGGAGSGPTSYALIAGTKYSLADNDGVFYTDSGTRLTDMTDGTSNTVWILETLRGDDGKKAESVARQHIALKKADLKGLDKESGLKEWKADTSVAGNRGSAWIDGRFLQATTNLTREFNDPAPDVTCEGVGGLAGPRNVQPGTTIAFADGSVRWIKGSVKLNIWQMLATRSGGEVVPNFD